MSLRAMNGAPGSGAPLEVVATFGSIILTNNLLRWPKYRLVISGLAVTRPEPLTAHCVVALAGAANKNNGQTRPEHP